MKAETKTTIPIPQKIEQQILAKFFCIPLDKIKRDRYNFHIENVPVEKLEEKLKEAGIKDE